MVRVKVCFWPVKGYSDVIPLQKAVMIRFRKIEEVVHWNLLSQLKQVLF